MITGAELQAKFDYEWTIITKFAASHPKTTIIVCLIVGALIGHFV